MSSASKACLARDRKEVEVCLHRLGWEARGRGRDRKVSLRERL